MARNNPVEEEANSERRKFIADAILNSAWVLRREADHLESVVNRLLSEEGDLGYVNEAITAITSVPQTARIDVIISRLLRTEKK